MASVSVTPMPSSVCKNRQLDQPGVRISPFVPLRLSFVLTIIALSVTSFAGKTPPNGKVDARRGQYTCGSGWVLRNTPPLASNDLCCRGMNHSIYLRDQALCASGVLKILVTEILQQRILLNPDAVKRRREDRDKNNNDTEPI